MAMQMDKKQQRIEQLESELNIKAGQSDTTNDRMAELKKGLNEVFLLSQIRMCHYDTLLCQSHYQIEMKEKEVQHLQQCLNKAEQELIESQQKLQNQNQSVHKEQEAKVFKL